MSEQQIHTENLLKVFTRGEPGEVGAFRRNLPNALTWIRVGLAVAFPFLPHSLWLATLVVAALTEWLDGALSRLWHVESAFGRMLDPVADKLFVVTMLATFVWNGWLSLAGLFMVAARDITVAVACVLILLFGNRAELGRMRPRILGKVTTTLQFAFLLALLFWHHVPRWCVFVVASLSGAAAVDYILFYFHDVRGQADTPAPTTKKPTTSH